MPLPSPRSKLSTPGLRAKIAAFEMNHRFGTAPTCAECGAVSSPGAGGWRALLGYDVRDGELPEVFTFCPECAERELGDII